jgi:hypothetical protein
MRDVKASEPKTAVFLVLLGRLIVDEKIKLFTPTFSERALSKSSHCQSEFVHYVTLFGHWKYI